MDRSECCYVECPFCNGTGIIIDEEGNEETCPHCDGAGDLPPDDPDYREWLYENYGPDDEY